MVISPYIPGLVHRNSWRRLQVESCALRERGLARGTWANKISHLRSYMMFTSYYGVPDFPIHLGVLLRYIALLGKGPFAYRSATNMLGSLKWFASLLDPSSVEIFETAIVEISMKGLKAKLSRPVHQKLPFSVVHLGKFYDVLNLANVKHLACWCAMLLSFFGCFRLSNLVPTAKCNFDPLKHLVRNDIRFKDNLVLVYFKWSKTNQNSSKVAWIPLCSVSDVRFNVQFHLKKLLSVVNIDHDAPLFTFNVQDFHSRSSLIRLLDLCLVNSGLSLVDYSWHSFRRGAAVFAFELGLSDSAVQLLGDWSSSAFKHYLEFAFLRKVTVAEKISKCFDDYVDKL